MGLRIEDGEGNSNIAGVDSRNRLKTHATVRHEIQAEAEEGEAYGWVSTFGATAGDEIIYIKNTDTLKSLHIYRVGFSNTVNTLWTLFKVTSGTAAGTTITGRNLNFGSGKTPLVTSYGNAAVTGTLTGETIYSIHTPAHNPKKFPTDGAIILDTGDELAVTINATGTVSANIFGYFQENS